MESKSLVLSLLLAFLLVGAGFSLVAMDSTTTDEQDETVIPDEGSNGAVNTPPSVLADAVLSMDWTGMNATVSGFVTDEAPQNTSLSVRVLDDEFAELNAYNITPAANGAWTIETSLHNPGDWIVELIAVDDAQQSSETLLIELFIVAPLEEQMSLTFRWDEPVENDTEGTISGLLLHQFPRSCTIEYHPLGQSPALLVSGAVNNSTGAYSIVFDTESHNTEGDLVSECGLFTESDLTVRVVLPMPPEPVGDEDGDAVLDDADECPNTPQGEPVYSTGCSDSETDDDEDGVMNHMDACSDTPLNETVDSNGCSQTQLDDDEDGVNNAVDLCPATPTSEVADATGCSPSQLDTDGDSVNDALDQCPNTPAGTAVGADGCPLPDWSHEDSFLCLDGQGAWAKDLNGDGNSYTANTRGDGQEGGGGGSGPWFQCEVSVSFTSTSMQINSNAIPNHNWLSAYAANADEQSESFTIALEPVNDTNGGHSSTNCPAANGAYECAPDRGPVGVAVNGVPIFGPEEGPGGDAVALEFLYFNEDRQPIDLGYCGAHNGPSGVHYHYDAMCQFWDDPNGETIVNYDYTDLDPTQHSPIIGWAFDGYPIYGMYTWDDNGQVTAKKSSYEVERTSEGGDQGYNGIDDWNYVSGLGDLDQCNGRFGSTPEYPEGTYYYVSTPISASTKTVVDTDSQTVPMIGFPYFLLCYHGEADMSNADAGGPPGGGPPGGFGAQVLYTNAPDMTDQPSDVGDVFWDFSWLWITLLGAGFMFRTRD
ncbi:MAG: YHYH protein [Candidatus Poseidonia sp.]|uniref:YHYH protein n=1 Tax=Poseidonia sp. TaxID=2666344 RepID=UPI0030BB8F8D|nr:YHYH protein [Poseidonia sp.]